MYTSFSVENFRCFERLTVEPLARVNLICGENNTGKTALLESIWLHSGPNSPDLGLRLNGFRGIGGPDPRRLLYDLFRNFDPQRSIKLEARGDWSEGIRSLKIKLQPRGTEVFVPQNPDEQFVGGRGARVTNVSAVSDAEVYLDFVDEDNDSFVSTGRWEVAEAPVPDGIPLVPFSLSSQGMVMNRAAMPPSPSNIFLSARHRNRPEEDVARFGNVVLSGGADSIVSCLKAVDTRIDRLETIAAPPSPMIYADIGIGRPVPMGFLGDGVGRLLSMALAFQEATGGTILIDEIENGLHFSAMKGVWENLDRLSRELNVQIFASTHSYECLEAARDAFKTVGQRDLHVHRLDRRDGGVISTTYPFDALDFTLSYGSELR
jgi:hypothetical protein